MRRVAALSYHALHSLRKVFQVSGPVSSGLGGEVPLFRKYFRHTRLAWRSTCYLSVPSRARNPRS